MKRLGGGAGADTTKRVGDDEDKGKDDEGPRARGRLRHFWDWVRGARPQTPRKRLEYDLSSFRQMEIETWRDQSKALQNLAWTLRSKQAEATDRAVGANRLGWMLTISAIVVAFLGAAGICAAWYRLDTYIKPGGSVQIPDHLWQLVIGGSAAFLMIVLAATLLFQVARTNFDRKERHECEADYTRQMEVAIRLVLVGNPERVTEIAERLALRLMKRPVLQFSRDKLSDPLGNVVEAVRLVLERKKEHSDKPEK